MLCCLGVMSFVKFLLSLRCSIQSSLYQKMFLSLLYRKKSLCSLHFFDDVLIFLTFGVWQVCASRYFIIFSMSFATISTRLYVDEMYLAWEGLQKDTLMKYHISFLFGNMPDLLVGGGVSVCSAAFSNETHIQGAACSFTNFHTHTYTYSQTNTPFIGAAVLTFYICLKFLNPTLFFTTMGTRKFCNIQTHDM